MRVVRLEIFGFKSFMERVVVPLEGGITGVVGPNGCGKSNIVDALRWVLGETKASNLRGGVLEDVIFNGTDSLRPLGLAEVSLTLRAAGDNLLDDLDRHAVEVDDLIGGIIEEAIGEVDATSEELQEAGGDQRPHLTVIDGRKGLPNVTQDIEPEEEPQQISKSNEVTGGAFFNRFAWLKNASEVQVTRRLYRSGDSEFFINRVPCRLRDIKEFFRAVGIGARGYTIVAQGEVSRIITSKPHERRSILEEAAGVLGFRDKIGASERRLTDTEANLARIHDVIKEVDRQVGSLKRQADRAKNREELKSSIFDMERTLYLDSFRSFAEKKSEFESNLSGLEGQESEVANRVGARAAKEQAARSDLLSVDVEGDSLRAKVDGIKEELHNRSRKRSESKSRINELKAFVLGKEGEISRMDERLSTLQARQFETDNERIKLEAEEASIGKEILSLGSGTKERVIEASEKIRSCRDKLKEADYVARKAREEFIRKESALKSAEEQLVSASPLSGLKETLKGEAKGVLSGNVKMFVEGINCPSQYSKALEAALAERAAFLVCEDPSALGEAFLTLRSGLNEQRQKGLGLGAVRNTRKLQSVSQISCDFPRLLDLIKVEPEFLEAATSLLNNYFLVDNYEEASTYFDTAPSSEAIIVTKKGEILSADTFFCFSHEGGLVQIKGRVEAFKDEVSSLSTTLNGFEKDVEQITNQLSSLEDAHQEAIKEHEEYQSKVRELSNRQGEIRGKLKAEIRILEQVSLDLERAKQARAEAVVTIEAYRKEEAQAAEFLQTLENKEDDTLREELDTLSSRYREIDKIRTEKREELQTLATELNALRGNLDEARAALSQFRLGEQRLDLEEANIRERISTEYGDEILNQIVRDSENTEPVSKDQRDNLAEEVKKLRARVIREGDVDPTTIDQYEEEKARLDELKAQSKDLEDAARTLRRSIEKLTETAEERFVHVFNAVQRNFSKLLPKLFGGGKGTISLSDPNKPLDSGIDITVRPPGKKLKSIDLLSGGEKALSATALIIAMFLERPSPLCVLDEVDAPLDEANLVRFLALITEMSVKTQFMVITHNKQSMASADNLIGVTMQQPGASNTITVSLQEAYSQVA